MIVSSKPKISNMVGCTFGKLTVLKFSYKDRKSNNYFECVCECGNRKFVAQNHLLSGRTKSCGCLRKTRRSRPATLQNKVDDFKLNLEKGLQEIGPGAVYTIVEVLNNYLVSNPEMGNVSLVVDQNGRG